MHPGFRATCFAAALAFVPAHVFAGCVVQRFATLEVTMSGSRPLIDGSINGVDARFFVDSGAFTSILSEQRLGPYNLTLEPMPAGYRLSGLGGAVTPQLAVAKDFTLKGLGNETFHKVEFLVTGTVANSDSIGMIGQNVLGVYDSEYDLANGVIRLAKPKDCTKQVLAYWHGDADFSEIEIQRLSGEKMQLVGRALLNDKSIEVLFDTGSPRSFLTEKAAARVGVTRSSPGTSEGGLMWGFGPRSTATWIARFDKLDLGGEQIKNARLRVGAFDLDNDVDLILGVDFFLSHRIYVAASQDKIYFTYNGGRVFDLNVVKEAQEAAAPASTGSGVADATAAATSTAPDALKDAAAYRRRGTASAERRDFRPALADLDQAVKLDPTDAQNFYSRAKVRWVNDQFDLAMQDLNEALRLAPQDVPMLAARGQLRIYQNDGAGARADFDAALRLAPKDSNLAFRVANYYVFPGHYKEALPLLDQWIAGNRQSAQLAIALHQRCYCRVLLNVDLEGAFDDCSRALRLSPHNAATLAIRGLVGLRRGDFNKAVADYKGVLQLQPGDASARYGLGLAELGKGLREQGQRDIDAAIALKPSVGEWFKEFGLTP